MSRASTKLWLINKSPPLDIITGADRSGFNSKYPPTGEQVLLQFYGYHRKKQEASGGTSSKAESVVLVVQDIEHWWSRTGIQLKATSTINYMVNVLINRYLNLQKHKERGGKAKHNRDKFVDELQDVLWVVDKKTEALLRTSTNAKKIEEWDYLEAVRERGQGATLGCQDHQALKKKKRESERNKERKL